ncbi:MAG: transposase [Syntrophobacteraceae bacterium]
MILENLHLLACSRNLSRDIKRFKSYTAKEILTYLQAQKASRLLKLPELFKRSHKVDSTSQVWEEGNHPQIIDTEEVLKQKLNYIHQNPVKRGYVDSAEHWRYSSARNYAGEAGLIEVCRAWQEMKLELPKPGFPSRSLGTSVSLKPIPLS